MKNIKKSMTRDEMCKEIVFKWNKDDSCRSIEYKELEDGKFSFKGKVLFKEFNKEYGEYTIDNEFDNWYSVFQCYIDEMADWEATEGEDAFGDFTEEERQFIMNEIKKYDLSFKVTDLFQEIGEVYKDDKLDEMLDKVYCYMKEMKGE